MNRRRLISTGSPFEATLGYSRAVVQGDWCFVAGITGYDYARMVLADGIAAQADACFTTLRRVLDDAGFPFSSLVRVTHYVADRALVPELSTVLERQLGEVRPAATMVLAELMEADMLYELEATAFKGG